MAWDKGLDHMIGVSWDKGVMSPSKAHVPGSGNPLIVCVQRWLFSW